LWFSGAGTTVAVAVSMAAEGVPPIANGVAIVGALAVVEGSGALPISNAMAFGFAVAVAVAIAIVVSAGFRSGFLPLRMLSAMDKIEHATGHDCPD